MKIVSSKKRQYIMDMVRHLDIHLTYHHLMSAIYMGKIYVNIQNRINITLRLMGNLRVNFTRFLKKKYLIYLENK